MNDHGCINCKHWHGGMTCDAYPEFIPMPIQSGTVSHDASQEGDNGIQFEPIDEEDTPDNG